VDGGKIAVIGFGIMGAAIVCALTQDCTNDTTLHVFDGLWFDGEATSASQDRVHGGLAVLKYASGEYVTSKYRGMLYLSQLGGVDPVKPAVYAFEGGIEDFDRFRAKAAASGVPVKEICPTPELRKAFAPSARVFAETLEYPTNFARLRHGMLRFTTDQLGDRFKLVNQNIDTIVPLKDGKLSLHSDGAEVGKYDLVINRAGRWAEQIIVRGYDQPLMPEAKQVRWPFFFVSRSAVPELPAAMQRVLTLMDEPGSVNYSSTFIPHMLDQQIITLDTKCPALEVADDPRQLSPIGPEKYDHRDRGQRRMMERIKEAFPIAQKISYDALRVVYGVHFRDIDTKSSLHYTPSDIMSIRTYDGLDGYVVPFGGLATTCMVDAFNVANHVALKLEQASHTHEDRLAWLVKKGLPGYMRNTQARNESETKRWERELEKADTEIQVVSSKIPV
jgi:hypothetical protein